MSHAEFIGLLGANPLTYSVTLAIMLAVYQLLFRKQISSVFDPLFFAAVFTAFAATDVVFLWWIDQIDNEYLIQFICTEAAFFVGIALFQPVECSKNIRRKIGADAKRFLVVWHGGERHFLVVLYVLSAVTFVLTQGFTYAIRGIPILYASRLEYYSVGGGIGALDRVLNVTWFISCYLFMYCLDTQVKLPRLLHAFVGTALVVSAILSGSKSTFTLALFAIFYFRFLRRGDPTRSTFDKSLAKLQRAVFAFTIVAAVLVISVQTATGDPAVLMESLSVRFASFGDVYFMAYPRHVVDMVSSNGRFFAVFGDLLAPFRILSYKDMPEPLGFLLHRVVFGFDDFTGPNARHNVFGLVYFGNVGSVFFSLVLGIIVGFIRNLLPAFVRPGTAVEPLYAFLAISCVTATTDFTLVMKDIVSTILVVPALYGMAALICVASRRQATLEPPRAIVARTTDSDAGSARSC